MFQQKFARLMAQASGLQVPDLFELSYKLQVLLGIATLLSFVSVPLGVLHQVRQSHARLAFLDIPTMVVHTNDTKRYIEESHSSVHHFECHLFWSLQAMGLVVVSATLVSAHSLRMPLWYPRRLKV